MTVLKQMAEVRWAAGEQLRAQMRDRLRDALRELRPAKRVIVFGSLLRAGSFSASSDLDIALEEEPVGISLYQLISCLAERVGAPVDVVLLSECRFRNKILAEGEVWTLPD